MSFKTEMMRIYEYLTGKNPDEEIEISLDGIHWFDPVGDDYAGEHLYYRIKDPKQHEKDKSLH